ncbi:hypothetical protein JCM10212_005130 [Sporobolomyces blumeae]
MATSSPFAPSPSSSSATPPPSTATPPKPHLSLSVGTIPRPPPALVPLGSASSSTTSSPQPGGFNPYHVAPTTTNGTASRPSHSVSSSSSRRVASWGSATSETTRTLNAIGYDRGMSPLPSPMETGTLMSGTGGEADARAHEREWGFLPIEEGETGSDKKSTRGGQGGGGGGGGGGTRNWQSPGGTGGSWGRTAGKRWLDAHSPGTVNGGGADPVPGRATPPPAPRPPSSTTGTEGPAKGLRTGGRKSWLSSFEDLPQPSTPSSPNRVSWPIVPPPNPTPPPPPSSGTKVESTSTPSAIPKDASSPRTEPTRSKTLSFFDTQPITSPSTQSHSAFSSSPFLPYPDPSLVLSPPPNPPSRNGSLNQRPPTTRPRSSSRLSNPPQSAPEDADMTTENTSQVPFASPPANPHLDPTPAFDPLRSSQTSSSSWLDDFNPRPAPNGSRNLTWGTLGGAGRDRGTSISSWSSEVSRAASMLGGAGTDVSSSSSSSFDALGGGGSAGSMPVERRLFVELGDDGMGAGRFSANEPFGTFGTFGGAGEVNAQGSQANARDGAVEGPGSGFSARTVGGSGLETVKNSPTSTDRPRLSLLDTTFSSPSLVPPPSLGGAGSSSTTARARTISSASSASAEFGPGASAATDKMNRPLSSLPTAVEAPFPSRSFSASAAPPPRSAESPSNPTSPFSTSTPSEFRARLVPGPGQGLPLATRDRASSPSYRNSPPPRIDLTPLSDDPSNFATRMRNRVFVGGQAAGGSSSGGGYLSASRGMGAGRAGGGGGLVTPRTPPTMEELQRAIGGATFDDDGEADATAQRTRRAELSVVDQTTHDATTNGSPRPVRTDRSHVDDEPGDEGPNEGDRLGMYRVVRVLGRGAFSKVALARMASSSGSHGGDADRDRDADAESRGGEVALKLLERKVCEGNERMRISVLREVEVLKNISHPNLVTLSTTFSTRLYTVLVLSYCRGGELFDFLADHHPKVTEGLARRIFGELASGVGWMHTVGLVHRDIKLENILLTARPFPLPAGSTNPLDNLPSPFVKLTDFGLSRFINPASPLLQTRCGSEAYAAPELLMGKPYDGRLTDSWAVGVVLFAVATGGLPFVEEEPSVVVVRDGGESGLERRVSTRGGRKGYLLKIAKADYAWPKRPDPPTGDGDEAAGSTGGFLIATDLKDLVARLLVRDPAKRWRIDGDEIWASSWMTRGEGAVVREKGVVRSLEADDSEARRASELARRESESISFS